jgi:hypothetical protein
MMPLVSDWSSPNGLPIANAICPTLKSAEDPMETGGGSCLLEPTRTTAK